MTAVLDGEISIAFFGIALGGITKRGGKSGSGFFSFLFFSERDVFRIVRCSFSVITRPRLCNSATKAGKSGRETACASFHQLTSSARVSLSADGSKEIMVQAS